MKKSFKKAAKAANQAKHAGTAVAARHAAERLPSKMQKEVSLGLSATAHTSTFFTNEQTP